MLLEDNSQILKKLGRTLPYFLLESFSLCQLLFFHLLMMTNRPSRHDLTSGVFEDDIDVAGLLGKVAVK